MKKLSCNETNNSDDWEMVDMSVSAVNLSTVSERKV